MERHTADGDAGLRTAEEFVSREQHHVRALLQRLPNARLVGEPNRWTAGNPGGVGIQQAAADVGDERCIQSCGDGGHLREGHFLGEALHAVVRGMDLEHGLDCSRHGGEVTGPRPVGCADLDEVHPRCGHQVGEAERSSNLDEFASRHRNSAVTAGKCGECQEQGSRVVVDDQCSLRSNGGGNERVQIQRPSSARTRLDIELEVAGTWHVGTNGRRSPEIRVEEYSGGVDHAAKPGGGQHPEAICCNRSGIGTGTRLESRARLINRLPCDCHEQTARQVEFAGEVAGERINGGKVARVHVRRLPAPVSSAPCVGVGFSLVRLWWSRSSRSPSSLRSARPSASGGRSGWSSSTAFVGSWLVARQGRDAVQTVRTEFAQGVVPAASLAHGVMIVIAGAFLLTPGLLTDAAGFLLLIPAVREAIRRWFVARSANRWTIVP